MRILKNKTFFNAVWLIGEKLFYMAIGLLTVSVVARYLGSEGYGMLSYAASFVALFSILSDLGMDNLNIKSIVQKEEEEGTIIYTSLILRSIGSFLILIIVMIFNWLTGIYNSTQGYLIIIISCTYLFKSLEVIEYWIQAYQNSKYSSSVRMVVTFISASLKITVIILNLGIITLACIYIIEVVLIGIGLIYTYFKFRIEKSSWQFSYFYAKKTLFDSKYIILSGIFVVCYTQLDRILIGNLASKQELGLYAAAMAISQIWLFVPHALINSFKPLIMKLKNGSEVLYYKKIQQLSSLLLIFNFFCALAFFISAGFIVNVIYGAEFLESTSILNISVWAGFFSIFGTVRGIWLICEGKQHYVPIFIGIGAVFSIILNVILIPQYGAIGAAITLLLTEFVSNILTPLLFRNTRKFTFIFLRAFLLTDLRNR